MFSQATGASKIAFIYLVKALQHWRYQLIDCQIYTEYLASFGAAEVSRQEFEQRLSNAVAHEGMSDWAKHWPTGL